MSERTEGEGGAGVPTATTLYERVGGRDFFVELVRAFYAGAERSPVLRPMYEEDLEPAIERLSAFLIQYFGGPREYEALRGEPMLRARHLPFKLDEAARDAWLECMGAAVEAAPLSEADRDELHRYFVQAANFFMNQRGLSISGN